MPRHRVCRNDKYPDLTEDGRDPTPAYCPRANPMEQIFGDVHDQVTWNHKRKRLQDLVADIGRYLDRHGPWSYRLSTLYQEPEVTAVPKRFKRYPQVA